MQPFGYFRGQAKASRQGQNIIIIVQTGEAARISSIEFNINGLNLHHRVSLSQKTRTAFTPKVGDIFVSKTYESAKQAVLQQLEQAGYLKARFTTAQVRISADKLQANIQLTVDSGLRYYFGSARIQSKNLSQAFIHRYIHFQPGDVYDGEQILKLNRNLSGSGYFKSVSVNPQISQNPIVPVDIITTPVPKYSYTLGLGFGTDTGPRVRGGLHIIPVNERGHRFDAMLQGSMRESALMAQYLIPGNDPMVSQYRIAANGSDLNYNTGESQSIMLSLVHSYTQTWYQRSLSINLLHERFNYTDLPTETSTLLFPRLDVTFRHVSNELFSPSGYNITLSALGAAKALASQNNLAQGTIDAKAAVFFEAPRLRLYLHGIQGYTAIDEVNQLPLSLAMLLGGNENLKAYSFNSIGPGKQLTFGSVELQKEFRENWYMIGFFDAGSVWDPAPNQMLYDAGAGIMWVSPVGPIKVALAQPINRQFDNSKRTPRLVINLGPDL